MRGLNVWQHRRPLTRTLEKLNRDRLNVGFLGGSITEAPPGHNWPEAVVSWLVETFPHVRFTVENAAIGATGSDLAVFRLQRDILSRGCDLVFVEYAVNDYAEPEAKRSRSREGLLRRLIAAGIEVVLVYTFRQEMYADMAAGRMPDSIAGWERTAEHYGIGSVWAGLCALDEIRRGRMRWEEWLPDGLHPTSRGSLSYAECVIRFLEDEWRDAIGGGRAVSEPLACVHFDELPPPLDAGAWDRVEVLPFTQARLSGPWTVRRSAKCVWIDQLLVTAAVGARLTIPFLGRGLALAFDFGNTSAEFRYRFDDGDWRVSERDRPDWCPEDGWFRLFLLTDELPAGEHVCELEVVHGDRPKCRGTNFRLALIGVIRS